MSDASQTVFEYFYSHKKEILAIAAFQTISILSIYTSTLFLGAKMAIDKVDGFCNANQALCAKYSPFTGNLTLPETMKANAIANAGGVLPMTLLLAGFACLMTILIGKAIQLRFSRANNEGETLSLTGSRMGQTGCRRFFPYPKSGFDYYTLGAITASTVGASGLGAWWIANNAREDICGFVFHSCVHFFEIPKEQFELVHGLSNEVYGSVIALVVVLAAVASVSSTLLSRSAVNACFNRSPDLPDADNYDIRVGL